MNHVPMPNSPEGRTAYLVARWLAYTGTHWKIEVWRLVHEVAADEGVEGFHLPKLGDDPDGLHPTIASILERVNKIKEEMLASRQGSHDNLPSEKYY